MNKIEQSQCIRKILALWPAVEMLPSTAAFPTQHTSYQEPYYDSKLLHY